MGIYKSYDIRGIYGKEWDEGTAHGIGRLLPGLLGAREVCVGRDARLSSPEIFDALTSGIMEAGCDVADIGLCDTPAVYYSTARYGFGGSVMITASHNPAEYNGLKISRAQAVPVGYDTGLQTLEKLMDARTSSAERSGAVRPGVMHAIDIRADYLSHLARFTPDISDISAVIDCSNGTVGVFLPDMLKALPGRFNTIFAEPDGSFPNHPPNPLEEENLSALKERVLGDKADLGICFDGDADRVMFVDETGAFISPDLITCLIGDYYFRFHGERLAGGSRAVTYDVRSSRAVVERLQYLGADPRICRVGHSFAKKLLRDTGGIFGGELAGHYYFRENYFCDSGMIAAFIVLSVLSREKKPLSGLIRALKKYSFSGELNFRVENSGEIVERIRGDYSGGTLNDIDGIRIDFPSWWFNLRRSNTEPLLRLVVEAATADELRERKTELLEKISRYSRGSTAAE
jgi:phosphomannomutase